jgi:hypothetical protein
MRVLHVLDHSIPLHSGYTFRTRSILREQRALGWETFHVTGAKQGASACAKRNQIDGLHFYRTAAGYQRLLEAAGAEPAERDRRPGQAPGRDHPAR